MVRQSLDTPFEIEKIQIDLIRKSSIGKRISIVRSLSETVMSLSRRAIKRSNPELSERELELAFISYHYGANLANSLRIYRESRK